MKFYVNKNIKNSSNASKNLEIQYQHEELLNISNNRLLAKHGTQQNLKYKRLRDNLSDDVNNMNLKYRMNSISTYDQLSKKKLNDLDAYKKGYKNRHSKKKGLAKLDCYCEKKIFNKIDEIYELSRSMQNDEKNFKKNIYHKFGYRLILFALFPILGVIVPILFKRNGPFSNWCASECADTSTHKHNDGSYYKSPFSKAQWESFFYIHMVLSFTLIIVVLTVIIYTLVKVVKYERLKAGKGKIKGKDCYRFCKKIFL
ncbi:Plasmodium exported protein, unknown function [Plasmodium vivax]|uniref:Variable surface protein Vir35 n=1 Tax=Plasmodium vivax TaxID=5855 RepID=A0A565A5Q7_PLAVI|nr:Plasmodium exported protein, unknown function [Plasmodium vivax]